MKKVGIVVLNYNNIDDTINCVESIYKHCNIDDFALCVVDNDSRLEVQQTIGEFLSNKEGFCQQSVKASISPRLPLLTYIVNDKNSGYASGNNVGLNYFKQFPEIGYYLVLNNDVLFTMDILKPLRGYLDAHEDVAVVSPLLYGKDGGIDYECARYEKNIWDILYRATPLSHSKRVKGKTQDNKILLRHPEYVGQSEVAIQLPSGSCMMFSRDFFEMINFFDHKTFLYFEEDILWKKIQRKGMKSVLLPSVSCIHLGACSTSKSSSDIISSHYLDSLVYYLNNYSKFPSLFVLCVTRWVYLRRKIKAL